MSTSIEGLGHCHRCNKYKWLEPSTGMCAVCLEQWATGFTTWSYRELLSACGFEAMYRRFIELCLKQGVAIPEREIWIRLATITAMTPPNVIRSLQAGAEHLVVNVTPFVSPPTLKLVH